MWASETSDQHQSAACEEYGDSFFKELLEAAGMSDTECDGFRYEHSSLLSASYSVADLPQ